ncbi:MAG: RNA polymerase sigma factor [Patescibacteria group bacterium]|nr:RNA polymerase sigma factor [Patescibacteria group bacterium]
MANYEKDQKLVAEILKGNEKALREFYQTHSPRLFSYILRKVAKEEDSQELLQDTLFAGLEAMRDYEGKSSLFTFLCAIANHKVVDFYRKKKLRQMLFSQMPNLGNLISELLSPEERYNKTELKEKIKLCWASLPQRYQTILRLKYVEGLTVVQIAGDLKETVKSIESALFRARKAFIKVYTQI